MPTLTAKQRETLVLRLQGASISEIAAKLSYSRAQTHMLILRAKRRIKRELSSPPKPQKPLPPTKQENTARKTLMLIPKGMNKEELVKALPALNLSVFLLRLEGLSFKEISIRLGINELAAKASMHRAKQKIREKFHTKNFEI